MRAEPVSVLLAAHCPSAKRDAWHPSKSIHLWKEPGEQTLHEPAAGLSLHFWLPEVGTTRVEKPPGKPDRMTSALLRSSCLPGVWEDLDGSSSLPLPEHHPFPSSWGAGQARNISAKENKGLAAAPGTLEEQP